LSEQSLEIPATGLDLALATPRPGGFAYVVRDGQGLELNRFEDTVAGHANVTRPLERNAEPQLALDRKDYAPGEEIEVSIRAPYAGAGLITIERERVYAHQWFKSSTLASVQRIRVPRDFEGNGYVTVHYIRDPASAEIFMSPLSYGVVPFTLSLAQRTNALTLSASEVVKPGQPLRIKLSATQPAHAVVFAVDEGILQVAGYRNPDPLGHFFAKRALELQTAQILDLVLPGRPRARAVRAPPRAGATQRGGRPPRPPLPPFSAPARPAGRLLVRARRRHGRARARVRGAGLLQRLAARDRGGGERHEPRRRQRAVAGARRLRPLAQCAARRRARRRVRRDGGRGQQRARLGPRRGGGGDPPAHAAPRRPRRRGSDAQDRRAARGGGHVPRAGQGWR